MRVLSERSEPKDLSALSYPERYLPPLPTPRLPHVTRHSSLATIFFKINTYKSVSKQRTLSTFRINTYEKRGEGEGVSLPAFEVYT
jgi:hypothetical protein